jgi:hypothetical protein
MDHWNGPPDHQTYSLYFFLWDHLKSIVHNDNPQKTEEPKTHIQEECNKIGVDILRAVTKSTKQ